MVISHFIKLFSTYSYIKTDNVADHLPLNKNIALYNFIYGIRLNKTTL